MKRFAALALACGVAGGLAWAQAPRIWTNPTPPAREALDRLNLQLGWRTRIPVDGLRDGLATVQHLGDQVIVQTRRGAVSALDPVTGATVWRTPVGEPYPVTYEVGYNDTMIFVANGTRVHALDRTNGRPLWEVNLPSTPSSPPAADAEAFYIALSNGRLSAFAFPGEPVAPGPGAAAPPATQSGASGSGAVRTQPVPTRPGAGGSDPQLRVPPPAPAASTGRTATVSAGIATGGRTVATAIQAAGVGSRSAVGGGDINRTARGTVDVNGPRLLWDYQTNLRIAERPVLGATTVLVASTGRAVVFLDRVGGARPTDFLADAPLSAPVGQYGETAYVAAEDGSVYAFDLPTRVLLWHYTANGAVVQEPQATDEDLFVTAQRGGLIRLNRATGDMVWQNPAATRFLAVNPKFVYATDRIGRLLVLDRARGTTLTVLDVRDFVIGPQNEQTDRMLLGANDGTLVSLHDRAYAKPLRLQNVEKPTPPPAEPPKSEEPKPEKPLPGSKPSAEPAKPADKPAKPAAPPAKPGPGGANTDKG